MMKVNKQFCLTLLVLLYCINAFAHGGTDAVGSFSESTIIVPQAIKAANITVAKAGSAVLKQQLEVVGKIVINSDTAAPIYPRYSGIIKAMVKNLGDSVNKGEAIATVESNESLQTYTIYSPITGTIVQKKATTGELAKGDLPIYQIANLETVWADFTLYRKESALVKKGMPVLVTGDEGKPQETSSINYISPLGIEDSQTTMARAILPNNKQHWLPGMYVNGSITLAEKPVNLAVPLTAIQHWENKTVVFVQNGNRYTATPVTLGEKDNYQVEIVDGLQPGQLYVATNSFFIKADLGKGGATHDD